MPPRLAAWWAGLAPWARSALCAGLMLALVALTGAVEATAPSGMYY